VLNESTETRGPLKKRAIRSDQALSCCEAQASIVNGQISGVLSQILSAMDTAGPDTALALVPAPGTLAVRIITLSEAASSTVAVPGIVVIATAALFYNMAQTKAAYDMLSTVATAIGQLFSLRDTGCGTCIRQRQFGQSNPRKTVVKKTRIRV